MQKNRADKSQKNKGVKSQTKYTMKTKDIDYGSKMIYLSPVVTILCIIPFIVKLKEYNPNLSEFTWFSSANSYNDFFLIYKQWAIIAVTGFMAIIILCHYIYKRNTFKTIPIFIPLAIYGILSLLSAAFSKYRLFSFFGSFEQFESIFVLLGYCIAAYYSYIFVRTEIQLKRIEKYLLVSVIIMSIIGFFQFIGHDLFNTDLFHRLIVPLEYRSSEGVTFTVAKGTIYTTLMNPNYVGVYVTLLLPLMIVIILFQKNIKKIIITIFAIIGLIICLIGSRSLSGFLGVGVTILCFILFMRKFLLKKYYITLPILVMIIVAIFALDYRSDNSFIKKLINNLKAENVKYALEEINTNDDNISIIYSGNKMTVQYLMNNGGTALFFPLDEDGQIISSNYDITTNKVNIIDERFNGISFGVNSENPSIFYIVVDGITYNFSNFTEDGTYYYLNRTGKWDKIYNAPSAIFTEYESFGSHRGYIWSRTIPLLKEYIFLGSGPDTFVTVFPHNDYIDMEKNGFGGQIITKPHNLYMQIAVQTGLLSLVAFLVFYIMYFIMSFRLYWKATYNSYYSKAGIAIFISTIGYMFAGLTNDSSINTAPIFWVLIGIGIAVNEKVKVLMKEEMVITKNKEK